MKKIGGANPQSPPHFREWNRRFQNREALVLFCALISGYVQQTPRCYPIYKVRARKLQPLPLWKIISFVLRQCCFVPDFWIFCNKLLKVISFLLLQKCISPASNHFGISHPKLCFLFVLCQCCFVPEFQRLCNQPYELSHITIQRM